MKYIRYECIVLEDMKKGDVATFLIDPRNGQPSVELYRVVNPGRLRRELDAGEKEE